MTRTPRRARRTASLAVLTAIALAVPAAPALAVPAAPVLAAAGPPDSLFQKVPLDTAAGNPMMLDIADDGRVFYIDRLGDVRVIRTAGGTVLAGHLDVETANESGLLALALDPGFSANHHLYLYYSPAGAPVDRLARFTVTGDTLDPASAVTVLDVPVQRAECCHHGAGLAIDRRTGNLWLSTGDNTDPFESDGYTPIDERAGRAAFDAQRSAGSTASLSGKILRIHPEPDGSYTVPAGNLFPPGTPGTRPEIYRMGQRNPFRLALDPLTGYPLVGDFGPDAAAANPLRGPQNTVEWDVVRSPGNAGWPYCIGPNMPYVDYDFSTLTSGGPFDCAGGPRNDSPNNAGRVDLPPAQPATVWYHYAADPQHFPQLSGGGPIAGPVYRYDPGLASPRRWPSWFDGRALFAEWTTDRLFTFQLSADSSAVTAIDPLLTSMTFRKPMDLKFGPDGALYVAEWGSGFGGDNTDAGIWRVDYLSGAAQPIAVAAADPADGAAPLTVAFSSAGSADPAGGSLRYRWDFGDGGTATDAAPTHTYAAGNYTAVLTVTNGDGASGTASVAVTSGNTAPVVRLDAPPDGGFVDWGDSVRWSAAVTDPEDTSIDCAAVTVQVILGHDSHGHPLDRYQGCSGSATTALAGHTGLDDLFTVLEASYTDSGGSGGAYPLTGRAQVLLRPKRQQSEFFSATGRTSDGRGTDAPGVLVQKTSDVAGGGANIGYIQDGDWWSVSPASLLNITSVRLRAASNTSGGVAQVRWNSPTGPLLGSVSIPYTGGWQTFRDLTVPLSGVPSGPGAVYLVARSPSHGPGYLFNVNWTDFVGRGATDVGPRVVSLRARVNGRYVTAEKAGTQPLIANRTAIGLWERFDVFDLGGGLIALRAQVDGDYTCAESAGAKPLIANRSVIGPWEIFQLIRNSDGTVSLRAQVNGRYVTAEKAGTLPLIANRTAIGLWEKFDLIDVPG